MLRRSYPAFVVQVAATLLAVGCNLVGPNKQNDAELAHYKQIAKTVEHPQLNTPPSENALTPEPRTIDHNAAPAQPQEWWELTLDDAIQLAVSRSTVLRDLGGTIVRSPDSVRTILNPAAISSDARFGMEAALSEFDATLSSSVIAEKNDRMINNFVASGGTRFFQQDLITFQSQVSKLGAAGTRMTLRGVSVYDFNNASFNRFPSVWDTLVEAEFRQPLLQGAGARFNRLAGPNAVPGFYNGVLIARVNADISIADFEMGLRDLVSNVENAYWDLYFAYRDLDAKLQLRNAALEAWKRIKVLVESDQAGGQIEREVQARELYFRYEEDVQNALAGTLQMATTNNNGASGGSFRGIGGVLVSERRLRLAMGLPITDGRMIRPADEPTLAKVSFEWADASDDAIARRPELLKQRLIVKRREMEYVAARNFLLPRFDILGRYRFRGLGRDLVGNQTGLPFDPADPSSAFANSSLGNLISGNFQEWQLGGEISMPVGFRRGWAAVRNAQVNLAREKAVLEEQERQIMHDLSNSVGDMQRAYQLMETTYNRRLAAQQNADILRFRVQNSQPVSAEQVLEGERRLAEADIMFHRSLVEHMLAIKNVHFEKGTLLEYGRIQMAEQFAMTHGLPPRPQRHREEPTPAAEPIPPGPMPETLPPGTMPAPQQSQLPEQPQLPPQNMQSLPPFEQPSAAPRQDGPPPITDSLPPLPQQAVVPPAFNQPPMMQQPSISMQPAAQVQPQVPPQVQPQVPPSNQPQQQRLPAPVVIDQLPPLPPSFVPAMPGPAVAASTKPQVPATIQPQPQRTPAPVAMDQLPPLPPSFVPAMRGPAVSAPPQPQVPASTQPQPRSTPAPVVIDQLPPLPPSFVPAMRGPVVSAPPQPQVPASTQPQPRSTPAPVVIDQLPPLPPSFEPAVTRPAVSVPPQPTAPQTSASPLSAPPTQVPSNAASSWAGDRLPPLDIESGLPVTSRRQYREVGPAASPVPLAAPPAIQQTPSLNMEDGLPRYPQTAPSSRSSQAPAPTQRSSMQVIPIPTDSSLLPNSSSVIERAWFSGGSSSQTGGSAAAVFQVPSRYSAPADLQQPAPLPPQATRLPEPEGHARLPDPDLMLRLPEANSPSTIMSWQRLPSP